MTQLLAPSGAQVAEVSPAPPDRYAGLLLASALAGQAITFNRGAYAEPAILCVVTGLLVLMYRFGSAFQREPRMSSYPKFMVALIWIALFAMVWTAMSDPSIVIYLERPWELGKKAQFWSLLLLASY